MHDPMPPFAGAKRMAEQIPQAQFMALDGGGHLLMGHHERVRSAITSFIKECVGSPQCKLNQPREAYAKVAKPTYI
jgi:hypothetical protein